ncbi:hypothetical protein QBC37DRAFT_435114 [Rhypophila decipiens]|uniref:Uncharacterized protein n=1 Tax=Rhypophila decipiens TaxID=261697 RepID=A0AAN6XXG9_9PEZI|nr:hypothetical protein QBC37DRAFT_435114 [Rhypophila decipiens]
MTSITRWLKGFWSGTRNDPERDVTPIVRESSTSLPSRPIRSPQTSQPATNRPELPVSSATGRPPLRGTISIMNGGRKYTGAVHLFPVGSDDLNADAMDGSSFDSNNNNNTWTFDRGIRFAPALDPAPELEAASSRPRQRTTSSSSGQSTIQGNESRSTSWNEPFSTGRSERAVSNTDNRDRGASSSSRTERGSSPPHDHVHSASSTATLSPRSVTVDVERQRSNSGTQDTGSLNRGHMRRDLPSATNNFNHGLVDSPPTPPASSAFNVGDSYTSPVVKQERLSPILAPTPPAKVPLTPTAHEALNEPEMQQVARQTIEIPFRTPSKPARGSATGSHASSGLMTPPDTNSARRPAVASVSGGGRVKSSSPPPSTCPNRSVLSAGSSNQTSTTSSGTSTTSLLVQSQVNGWDASPLPLRFPSTPSSSPAPASQRQTGRPFRPPIQEDPTLEWTSIRELVAAPLINGRRILPRYGPACSRCRQAGQGEVRWMLQDPVRGGSNAGRAYYKCQRHGFGTFADLEGEEEGDGGRRCDCPGGPLARRTERKDGGVFWKCLEMKCSWSEG